MAAAVQPRADLLGDDLPRTTRKSEEADQMRQLLALPVILDGGSRREAARTGGGGLQVIRDGVLRFKAGGAEALVTRKAPGKTPILTDEHRTVLAATVEAGPKPDMDGIGRWRRVDLAQGAQEEPGVPVRRRDGTLAPWGWPSAPPARSTTHRTTRPSRRSTKRLRRRRPHPQPMGRQADRAPGSGRRPDGSEEQTHATPGAAGDAAPRAARSADRRGLSLRGHLPCQGQGRVRPWCDTHPMAEPLRLIGQQVEAGAHALLIPDRAGGQSSPKWAVPDNIILVPRPPRAAEVNPVENVWPFIRDTWLSTLVFKTCDDIADHCCQAWNTLMHQPGRAISIGGREWDHRV